MSTDFFIQRPAVTPTIYVYTLPGVASHTGYIKVGYTERDVEKRIYEQTHTSGVKAQILLRESAMCPDGSCFTDHDIHRILERRGFRRLNAGSDRNEWFNCKVEDVGAAITELKTGIRSDGERTATFRMRPEQVRAVERTADYFRKAKSDEPGRVPKFLWNAKMRFGKTFASYELAKKMGLSRILVLTFKPAVESAWREDLVTHVDFDGWQFVSNKDAHMGDMNMDRQYEMADKSRPIVVFGSFQDLLGTNEAGGIKAKNEFIHTTNWDLVIFDEYHFGAWRENAKKLFENPDEEESADFDAEKYSMEEAGNAYNETFLPITTSYYLFLSGTPFRAINSGEFIEDQIFNWTYSDEQRAKETWVGSGNPYLSLPRMVMLTYRIPDSIRQIAMQGEFNEFDLNVFFSAKGKGEDARFVYENEVQKWLDLIRGSYLPSNVDDMKLGQDRRPPMPYSDTRLLNVLSHTLWFLPNVAACFAMYNLLMQKQNAFYHDYRINVCAGTRAGIGLDALAPVLKSMGDPLKTKTITLSCGKLTTGVTVRPWTGVFMLRNLKSPETYFQTAFRVQSPWEITDEAGNKTIMKQECYVFDFALDRALRQISDYSCRLDVNESNPEKKVAEFIGFLPVLAYDGSTMRQINAQDVLDIAMAGMLAGAPKIGKSWMALDLALHVAKGEALWGLKVHPGTVLYLCLEDGNGRIHDRLNAITDEGAGNLFLSFEADSLNDGLIPQLMNFKKEHPDLALIIIDTFQIIRKPGNDASYASDYEEVRQVKRLADELNLTILLIHHLRKMGDSDPLNKISGSTGISGAVDAVFVLDHAQRGQADGVLECTGRDIPSRRIELHFDSKTCIWSLMKDSLDAPEILLPSELSLLSEFMRAEKEYRGDNSEFAERYNAYAGTHLSPKALKQMMNRSQRLLAENGVKFQSKRSNGQRYLFVQYLSSALPDVTQSDSSDAEDTVCETCVPSVPCVPDT